MAPTVGIPICLDTLGRWRPGRTYQYVDARYAAAVESAGGTPIYLPMQRDAASLVERIDALLVPGGDDLLPPAPYPESVRFDPVPGEQLSFDRELLDATISSGKPVLGICYGMQLLALRFGGTLHYDLPTDLPDAAEHRLDEATGRHEIAIEPDSQLGQVLGARVDPVNSLHHQAVADPGELRISARTHDGVIEAVEHPDGFCLGVQWHPEKLPDAQSAPLFRALVRSCR